MYRSQYFFFETLYLGQLPRREIVQGRGCGRRQGALRGGVCSGLGGRGGENPREKLKNGRMDELKNGKMEEFCEPNSTTQIFLRPTIEKSNVYLEALSILPFSHSSVFSFFHCSVFPFRLRVSTILPFFRKESKHAFD